MVPVLTNSAPKEASGAPNCRNTNCPRHGSTTLMSATAVRPSVTVNHVDDCKDKNCPRHGSRPPSANFNQPNAMQIPSNSVGTSSSYESWKVGLAKRAHPNHLNREIDELVEQTQQMLRISSPAPKAGGTNNVTTIITTNNNNLVESPYKSMSTSPSVSPLRWPPSSPVAYDQMKMDHALKENVVLQSITVRQGEEIMQLKGRVKELELRLQEGEEEMLKLKIKNKDMLKMTQEWKQTLKQYQENIKHLKSRLLYTDLKAKQLKRMASENAATASKWRSKVLESLEAQKEAEERKNARAKAALGTYRQFREEKNKITDLKNQNGIPITDGDLDNTISTTMGILDTTMIDSTIGEK